MDFALEGPWLVITNKGAIPTVTVHAVLHVGDACALDRRWRWNGGANDYVNLGRNDASPYRDAMGRAIELLASVIAWDLFQSTEPRMVAFRSEKSVLKGEPPLAVIDPLSHMGTIASWDTVAPNSFGREICQGFSTQSGSPVEMIKHTHHF